MSLLREYGRRDIETCSQCPCLSNIDFPFFTQDGADHRLAAKFFSEVRLRKLMLIHQEAQDGTRCRIRNRDMGILVVLNQLTH